MNKLPSSLWVDLIGAPYQVGARGPDSWDCYGLVLEIFRRRGIDIPAIEIARYMSGADLRAEVIAQQMKGWRRTEIHPGAGLLFRDRGLASHVGVAIDDDIFIHASEPMGQVRLDRLTGVRPMGGNLIGAFEYAV